ncbi:MAG: hypothetical protein K1X85_11095 [Ignavibacteria bacterium]|nr:hypothetical protein [Ignavibacteria bacterium]
MGKLTPDSDINLDGYKIRLIALSTSGIIIIWLLKENDIYTGKWGYDKEMTEMKLE